MSLTPAKIILEKINTLYKSMIIDENNVNAIERDLMLSYIRQLYDVFLTADNNPGKREPSNPEPARQESKPERAPEPPAPVLEPAPVKEKEPEKILYAAPLEPEPKVFTPAVNPEPEPETPPVLPEPMAKAEEPPPAPKTAPTFGSSGADSLFLSERATDLSAKLSDTPIPDIKKAMGLNDRMFISKELFGGDNVFFDESLRALNSMGNFEEAKLFMMDHLVTRFRWTSEDKKQIAKDFIKLIKRRYK